MADFDPYLKWLGIRDPTRPVNHYRLLGLEMFESDPDVITIAADRQMAHIRTYQAGPNGDLSQKILNELARARRCLLVAEKKAAYDQQLAATSAVQQAPMVSPDASSALATPPQIRTTPARAVSRPRVQTVVPEITPTTHFDSGVAIKQDPNARKKIKRRERKQLLWTLIGWVSGALAAVGVSAWLIGSGLLGNIGVNPDEPVGVVEDDRTPRSVRPAERESTEANLSSNAPTDSSDSNLRTGRDSESSPADVAGSTEASESRHSNTQSEPTQSDDLMRISGVSRIIREELVDAGVTQFKQLAQMSPNELKDLLAGSRVSTKKSKEFESWIDQARELAGISTADTDQPLAKIIGIDPSTRDFLISKGIDSLEKLADFKPEELLKIVEQRWPGKHQKIGMEQWILQARKLSLPGTKETKDFFPENVAAPEKEKSLANIPLPPGLDRSKMADPPSRKSKKKLPEPTSAAIRKANIEVLRLYSEIEGARNTWLKSKRREFRGLVSVAEELIDDARQLNNNPDVHFGLLDTARGIGVSIGDAKLAIEAVREMDAAFEIDYWKRVLKTIEAAADNANSYTERNFKRTIDDLIKEGNRSERFDASLELIGQASKMASRARDQDAKQHYKGQEKLVKELKKYVDKSKTAIQQLEANANDPIGNLNQGHYLFVVKEDTNGALSYWAKSGNANWVAIAKLEKDSKTEDPNATYDLAKSWKELGSAKKPNALQRKCLQRALELFKQAGGKLGGLKQRTASNEAREIEERLKE